MRRVSSPELDREFPAPHASTKVTRTPLRSSDSAVHPPNAPAPTTTMCGADRWGSMWGFGATLGARVVRRGKPCRRNLDVGSIQLRHRVAAKQLERTDRVGAQ